MTNEEEAAAPSKLDIDVKRALRMGHDEIVRLRRRLDEVEPKAHAYDTIAQVARLTMPPNASGFCEDPAWLIRSIVERDDKLSAA
jgi:hypothetical protein